MEDDLRIIADLLKTEDQIIKGYKNDGFEKDTMTYLTRRFSEQAIKNSIPEEIKKLNYKKSFDPFVLLIFGIVCIGIMLWVLGIIYLIQK